MHTHGPGKATSDVIVEQTPESTGSSASGRLRPESVRSVILLLGLISVLGFVSWHRTGDPLRDWGRELYTAWRISEGDLLYRDVASLVGPLSHTLNGALFTIVGAGQSTLALLNLVILGTAAFLLMDLCTRLSDRGTGWLASVLFLTIFGFGHLTPLGNYNFVSPYSHAATHGTVLSIVAVWALARWLSSGSWSAALIAGLAVGASWMTKPEIALASTLALLIGAAVGLRAWRCWLRLWSRSPQSDWPLQPWSARAELWTRCSRPTWRCRP